MKSFFKGVRKHIGKLDAGHLREQYELVADEMESMDMIFNAIDRGIIVLDENGVVTRSNPAARLLLGMDPTDALEGLSAPLGKASKREFEVTYPERRDLEMQTIPMKSGTIVYLRDISAEKQRTEEELRAGATQAVCDLAAGVAHEIGNPLNAISMSLQLIERDPTDRESVETCMSQVKRLDGIVREFLAALRPRKPNLMPGSPADPLKRCLNALRQQFVERRITVTLDVPAALPPVALDADQMEQVFFNLVKNALEAMRDGGEIGIALFADDRDIRVVFRDNGMGMTTEQLTHLFEPYRTSKERGTGLGLMISRRIVQEHGGSIAAESEVGNGTTFTVILPRLEKRIRVLK